MRRRIAVAAALAALPVLAFGQIEPGTLPAVSDFGAQTSVTLDWRIADGLHFEAGAEERFRGGLSSFDRFSLSSGLNYKVLPFLKLGASYSFLSKDGGRIRHRAAAYLQGNWKSGLLSASLRGTFQITHKAYESNIFQGPRDAYAVKTRLQAAYQLPGRPFKPYVQGELRFKLNEVDWNRLATSKKGTLAEGYAPQYTFRYMDRIRARAGCEWRINGRGSLDVFGQFQFGKGLEIDANAEGKIKKDSDTGAYLVNWLPESLVSIGIAYTFSLR